MSENINESLGIENEDTPTTDDHKHHQTQNPTLSGHTVLKAHEGEILLSERKILFKDRRWGNLYLNSIMLDKITSVELRFKSNFALLILSVLALFSGPFIESVAGGILIAVIFGLFYYFSIKRSLKISSASSSISLSKKHLSEEEATKIINSIELSAQNFIIAARCGNIDREGYTEDTEYENEDEDVERDNLFK